MKARLEAYGATELNVSSSGRNETRDFEAVKAALEAYLAAFADTQKFHTARLAGDAKAVQALAASVESRDAQYGALLAALDRLGVTAGEIAGDLDKTNDEAFVAGRRATAIAAIVACVAWMLAAFFGARLFARKLGAGEAEMDRHPHLDGIVVQGTDRAAGRFRGVRYRLDAGVLSADGWRVRLAAAAAPEVLESPAGVGTLSTGHGVVMGLLCAAVLAPTAFNPVRAEIEAPAP
jgi:hypothetical protein